MLVAVGVRVGVLVGGTGVLLGVLVAVLVGVGVGVFVGGAGVLVGVGVGVLVGVFVYVGVGEGVGWQYSVQYPGSSSLALVWALVRRRLPYRTSPASE